MSLWQQAGTHKCTHTCMCILTHVYTCMYVHTCETQRAGTHVCVHTRMHVITHVHMHRHLCKRLWPAGLCVDIRARAPTLPGENGTLEGGHGVEVRSRLSRRDACCCSVTLWTRSGSQDPAGWNRPQKNLGPYQRLCILPALRAGSWGTHPCKTNRDTALGKVEIRLLVLKTWPNLRVKHTSLQTLSRRTCEIQGQI